MQYHGGGGNRQYCGVCGTVGDIMSTAGDILSTVGDVQYHGGYHDNSGQYLEYHGRVQYCGVS